MSIKESEVQCNTLSVLDVKVDNVMQILKNHEEEVQKLDQKKLNLEVEMEIQKRNIQQLEFEKDKINAEVTTLRFRNATYQKEHTNLRNAITVVKFQIEKIKESISKAKANDLKDLEDFEKTVDEITEKFRSGPDIYNRSSLLEKIGKEKEKKSRLIKTLEEIRNSYDDFNKEKGLKPRTNDNEKLQNCILPGSKSYCLIEMTKILDDVICQIKRLNRVTKQDEKNL